MNSKTRTIIKGSAITLALLALSGCTSGMQTDVDALKSRVDQLEQELEAAQANSAAALSAAENAQLSADEALTTANQAIEYNDATNEKVDRMFQRSQSK
jgi:outer membrane murein-binding lipoprotein Lpp